MHKGWLFLALFLAVTVGCNDNERVAGRKLMLDSHEGAAVLAGALLELRFLDEELSVYAGCNQISAHYRIRGGRLHVDNLSSTLVLCEPAVDVEDWFQTFLSKEPSIEVLPSGAVVMKQGSARLVFVDHREKPPQPPAPPPLPGARDAGLRAHPAE